jgi:hypothetical protein
MRSRAQFLGPTLATALLAACGGGGSDLTAAEAYDITIESGCARAFECADEAPDGWEAFYGEDVEECSEILHAFIGDLAGSEADGRINFDAEAGQTCLDAELAAQDAKDCTEFWATMGDDDSDPACADDITGTVEEGGECYALPDCAPGLVCSFPGDFIFPGTCEVDDD